MKETLVSDKTPFKQSMLSQNECYILDNGAERQLFVWKGNKDGNQVPQIIITKHWFYFANNVA